MSMRDLLGGRYLSSEDMKDPKNEGKYLEFVGDVLSAGKEKVGTNDEGFRMRAVIEIEGVGKPVVLNATNLELLCDTYGDEGDDWLGHPVGIRVEMTKFAGRKVPGIRLFIPEDKGGK